MNACRLLLPCGLLGATLAVAQTPPAKPAEAPAAAAASAIPIPADLAQAITREVLRPNGDPEGFPLPLAARWTGHNLLDANTGSPGKGYFITYPFTIDRVLDDIAAGHRVMPFMGWPHASMGPNYYFEETASFQHGFRRLAAAKMPFEIEAGNIEGAMLGNGIPMAKPEVNPAFIDQNLRLTVTAAAAKDAKAVAVKGFAANATLAGGWLLLGDAGRPATVAGPVTADANGNANLTLNEALSEPLPVGTIVRGADARMDFWSKAPEATWRQGGASILTVGGYYSLADWKKLAEIYPDPPQIQIVSNNEGAKGHIGDAPGSWHAQQRKGEDLRQAFAQGYVSIWQAYMRGMREAMPWKPEKIKAIGYNAFGVNFEVGRWGGWGESAITLGKVDLFGWLAWDGSAPDYYAYDWNYATDEHVGSPHIGAMQAYTMLSKRAIAQVPDYLWQLALWDGGIKKRYRYAADGTLTGIPVGTIATAPQAGAVSLQLRGGKPGTTVLDSGDLIGIAGHSSPRPTRCSAEFDSLTFESDTGERVVAGELTLSDVGAVPLPGILSRDGDKLRLSGSGRMVLGGFPDAMTFCQRDFTGLRSISVRLLAFGDGKPVVPAKSAGPAASVPDNAAHVDRQELERQRAQEQVRPEDQAGIMLRNGTGPNAGFMAVVRNRSGKIAVLWRSSDDPGMNSVYTGGAGDADTPTGPVYVRLIRVEPASTHYRPEWSVDGVTWQPIGNPEKYPWIVAGAKPLVAGLLVSTCTSGQGFQYYTVKSPVLVDATGTATITLDTTERSGPVGADAVHPAITVGATIHCLDYASRYEGFCNLALWLTRPRIVREFAWGDYDHVIDNHWKALMRATDRVWSDPVLTRFWRKGKLLANPAYAEQTKRPHPMNELGEFWGKRWAGLDCFFQLSVAINPPFTAWPSGNGITNTWPDQPGGVIKVWAIAYELGKAPNREWLLLAQSPREDRKAVAVTVPGFGNTTVDVDRSGSFYHLREGDKVALRVGEAR